MTSAGREQLNAFKHRMSDTMGGSSDHLLLVRVHHTWRSIRTRGVGGWVNVCGGREVVWWYACVYLGGEGGQGGGI